MAVFTPVSDADARAFLGHYDAGLLVGIEGIASGIENSNFFLDTDKGRFVLTVFERLEAAQLPFYLGLMRHLAKRGIPCPAPLADTQGKLFNTLHGKPAALVSRLSGKAVEQPVVTHCEQVGALLAQMHLAASDYPQQLPNPRGRDWWEKIAPQVRPFLAPETAQLLDDELSEQRRFAADAEFIALPSGPVHADLFRDNALFASGSSGATKGPEGTGGPTRITGVIDFYFAGCDSWLYDLAVTANDWCIDDDSGQFDPARLNALLDAYQRVRPLRSNERRAWSMMLRAAALRFWLSRLHDLHSPRPAQLVNPKDPGHFERILKLRRNAPPSVAGQ